MAICGPGAQVVSTRVRFCINCKRRRRFYVSRSKELDYYGEYGTCLTCGEQYGGGEWLPRPFAPRWRVANVAKAKRKLLETRARL